MLSKLLPLVIGQLGPSASPAKQRKVGWGLCGRCALARRRAHAQLAPSNSRQQASSDQPPTAAKQVLEILSHANKRTKAAPGLRLPLADLAALYAAPATAPMARNFAVVYLEQAVARATPAERYAQARRRPPQQARESVVCLCCTLREGRARARAGALQQLDAPPAAASPAQRSWPRW